MMSATAKWFQSWRERPPRVASLRYVSAGVALAAVYYLAGIAGLRLSYISPYITLVWPDSGIALAAVVLLGYRVWPALFVGAVAVGTSTGAAPVEVLVIAVANTAEALVGAALVARFAGGEEAFDHPRSTFRYFVLAAVISTAISATAGVGIISLSDHHSIAGFGSEWLSWWLGDLVGDLVAAPFLIVVFTTRRAAVSKKRLLEALLLFASLCTLAWFFSDPALAMKFLCIPALVWAAVRFGKLGAVVSVLLLSISMVAGFLAAHFPEAAALRYRLLLDVQSFIAVASAMTLTLAAVAAERSRAAADLRKAHDALERRVEVVSSRLEGTEERLQVRERLLARAEAIAHTGSFQWEAATDHVVWSDELVHLFDRSRTDISDGLEYVLRAVAGEEREYLRKLIRRTYERGSSVRVLTHVVRRNGERRLLDCVYEPLTDMAGTIVGVCGVWQDVTEREENARKLSESEDRFRLLVDQVRDYAIFLLDVEGRVASWNEGAERIMGYQAHEIVGRHISCVHTAEDIASDHSTVLLEAAAASGSVQEEGWRVRKDGERFWADVVLTALHDEEGNLRGFAKVTRDLTERRQAETALSELSARLLQVQDEEQRRIARELHDTSSPQLTSLIGKLYALKRKLPAYGLESSAEEVDEALTLAESISRFVRGLASRLYPPLLERNGLLPSLRWYVDSYVRRTGIRVELECSGVLSDLSPETEILLFRIAQECLTNIDRHAEASSATVHLARTRTEIVLEVRDDGQGMPAELMTSAREVIGRSGLGIRGMIERLRQAGGSLEIATGENGTTIVATVPSAASLVGNGRSSPAPSSGR